MSLHVLLIISVFFCVALGGRAIPVGKGFWNVRASFVIDGLDIGTQMSLVQLNSGKFLILDTIEIDSDLKKEIDSMTSNGTLIEAVIATHPFHTIYFPDFYKMYPAPAYYGTPRHIRIQPQIPWAGSMFECAKREMWQPEIRMRIPRGAEFVDPQPESSNHFSGIHVFHVASRTIHVDDTIMVDEPFRGSMLFHPTLALGGLYHIPESPTAFKNWVKKMIKEWDFDNICAAHDGIKQGGAKTQLQHLLTLSEVLLDGLILDYFLFPNANDTIAFNRMEEHESHCKE
jgi:hypothetical protein